MNDLLNRYKAAIIAASFLASTIWYGVLWANDKLEKIERVPQIESKVNELAVKVDELSRTQRLLVQHYEETSRTLENQNAEILNRLDRLMQRGG